MDPQSVAAVVAFTAILTAVSTAFFTWRELKRKVGVDAIAATTSVATTANVSAQSALVATQTLSAQITLMTNEITRLNIKVQALDVSIDDCQKGRALDQASFAKEREELVQREIDLKDQLFDYLKALVENQKTRAEEERIAHAVQVNLSKSLGGYDVNEGKP